MESAIQLFRVSKIYETATMPALREVSVEVGAGELVFLTGPSGAGKTTLLRLITGDLRATTGGVVVLGRNLSRAGRRDLTHIRREIGVVYQDPLLLEAMSAFENVELALEVRGVKTRERKRRVLEALTSVGLKDKRWKRAGALSAGEQQRVALARALVSRPRILLADEPTGNLDPDLAREILGLLDRQTAEGMSMIIATHAWSLVSASGRRTLRLEEGRLVDDGCARAEAWGAGA